MQLSQPLSENGIAMQYTFSRVFGVLLEQKCGVLNITWFFTEALAWMVALTSKSDFEPQRIQGNPLYPERVII
jgi:hypothetical protein